MTKDPTGEFKAVVLESPELPDWVKGCIESAHGVEAKFLEQSYLEFLDDMIRREPRGPEWSEVLKRRRTALSSHCGSELLSGFVDRDGEHLFVNIDPVTRRILYWEIWPVGDDSAIAGGESE